MFDLTNLNFPVLDRGGGVQGGVQHCGQGEGEDGDQDDHWDHDERLAEGCDPGDMMPVTLSVSDHSDELD